METLQIDHQQLEQLITDKCLRYTEIKGEYKFPTISVKALKIQMSRFRKPTKLQRRKPTVRRVY